MLPGSKLIDVAYSIQIPSDNGRRVAILGTLYTATLPTTRQKYKSKKKLLQCVCLQKRQTDKEKVPPPTTTLFFNLKGLPACQPPPSSPRQTDRQTDRQTLLLLLRRVETRAGRGAGVAATAARRRRRRAVADRVEVRRGKNLARRRTLFVVPHQRRLQNLHRLVHRLVPVVLALLQMWWGGRGWGQFPKLKKMTGCRCHTMAPTNHATTITTIITGNDTGKGSKQVSHNPRGLSRHGRRFEGRRASSATA